MLRNQATQYDAYTLHWCPALVLVEVGTKRSRRQLLAAALVVVLLGSLHLENSEWVHIEKLRAVFSI